MVKVRARRAYVRDHPNDYLAAIQEIPGSIPGYTLEIFLEVKDLERGPPSLVTTIG